MNFRFDYEESTGRALVRNTGPKPGEAPVYAASIGTDPVKQGYAIIALLPNIRRTGSVLILAGTSTAETETAGYFVTSGDQFSRILAALPGAAKKLPWFEVLLKIRRVHQNATQVDVVAYRLPAV
jgi:hypothetical protein